MRRILPLFVAGLVGLILVDRFSRPARVPPAGASTSEVRPVLAAPHRQARPVTAAPRPPADLLLAAPGYETSPVAAATPSSEASPDTAPSSNSPVASSRDPRLQYLTVQALAGRVQPGATPSVLVLYGTHCPLSRRLMPGLQQIATQYQSEGVRVLAINVDDDEPGYDVPAFLAATGARFPPIRLSKWRTSELSTALNSLGSKAISSGQGFTMPVVVVWGPKGTVLAESQGMSNASALEQVVKVALDPRSR
jgi:thiol-disulfide isomerase/thioredoxin